MLENSIANKKGKKNWVGFVLSRLDPSSHLPSHPMILNWGVLLGQQGLLVSNECNDLQ